MYAFSKILVSCTVAAFLQQSAVMALPSSAAGVPELAGPQQLNVDTNAMASIVYGTCDAAQQAKIVDGIRTAQGLIDDLYGYMTHYPLGTAPNPDDRHLDRFKTWFGKYTPQYWSDIKARVKAMKENDDVQLNSLTYNCNNLAKCGTFEKYVLRAWVDPGKQGLKEINLCPPFFYDSTTNIQHGHILVHEIAHFKTPFLPGANDDTWEFYTSVGAWGLARLSPDRAVKNADNIAWFARHPDMCNIGSCPLL